MQTQLKWRICSRDGAGCIIDWTPFEGKDLTQSVQATDADGNDVVISQLVHVVDQLLPETSTLRNGVEYYVEILMYNAAGERIEQPDYGIFQEPIDEPVVEQVDTEQMEPQN